jgi:hypothetical protein
MISSGDVLSDAIRLHTFQELAHRFAEGGVHQVRLQVGQGQEHKGAFRQVGVGHAQGGGLNDGLVVE